MCALGGAVVLFLLLFCLEASDRWKLAGSPSPSRADSVSRARRVQGLATAGRRAGARPGRGGARRRVGRLRAGAGECRGGCWRTGWKGDTSPRNRVLHGNGGSSTGHPRIPRTSMQPHIPVPLREPSSTTIARRVRRPWRGRRLWWRAGCAAGAGRAFRPVGGAGGSGDRGRADPRWWRSPRRPRSRRA